MFAFSELISILALMILTIRHRNMCWVSTFTCISSREKPDSYHYLFLSAFCNSSRSFLHSTQICTHHGNCYDCSLPLWGPLSLAGPDVGPESGCSFGACANWPPHVHGLRTSSIQPDVFRKMDTGSFPQAVSSVPSTCTVVKPYRWVSQARMFRVLPLFEFTVWI